MFEFRLPDLGEGIAEAEIVSLSVKEGDQIKADQVVAEVMTDKAVVEISSPRSGALSKIHGAVGSVFKVGDILFEIDDGQVDAPKQSESKEKNEKKKGTRAASNEGTKKGRSTLPEMPSRPSHLSRPGETPSGSQHAAVPAVRDLASRLEVNLSEVVGTGPGGRIMRRDVESVASQGVAPTKVVSESADSGAYVLKKRRSEDAKDWRREAIKGVRRAMGKRMSLSKSVIPHFTYVEEINMTPLLAWIRKNEKEGGISPLVFIAHAVCRTLKNYPYLNASIDDEAEEIILKKHIHLGIAADTPDGLMVPVVHRAGGMSLARLGAAIQSVVERARQKKCSLEELTGSSFTLSSLGKLGGLMATPIINYPEVGILGIHEIKTVPRFGNGKIVPNDLMNLSLSLDHRIADGMMGAKFIHEIKQILENVDYRKS
jgi:pyruvate dehydrogenase E2 component (dihydrolipoamide acetyltransferase)